jgi:hypothetical protein
VELIEANETPAVVIVKWPSKATVVHPHRFPDLAAMIVRLFAEAATRLAAIKRGASAVTTSLDARLTQLLVDRARAIQAENPRFSHADLPPLIVCRHNLLPEPHGGSG